jgi:glycosyltransferase involved in cell wall biosynthesis
MVGRLVDVKGGHHLIQALPLASARLAYPLSLTIAGSGPEEPRLRTLAKSIGADVNFAGWVEGAKLDSLMRKADLLAIPSLWPEPFGLVGIEAGCVGLPSVAYASGGVLDWLIAGESGELAAADPPTPAGLADAIVRALADPPHHQRLRHGAWEMSKRFSVESHMDKLESIMERAAHDASVCV